MTPSRPHLVGALAGAQIIEIIASAAVPSATRARLDRLGVPPGIRSALPAIKITISIGLILGLKRPRVGMVVSAAMVAFYTAAVGFHFLSGDPIIVVLPAVAFGAGAAGCLLGW
jgi:hypothetical protein